VATTAWTALAALVAAVAAWTTTVHYPWAPTLAPVPTERFTRSEDDRARILGARVPVKLTGALSSAGRLQPQTVFNASDRLSLVVLTHVQGGDARTAFSRYDGAKPLASARYLRAVRPTPLPDLVTARDFWTHALTLDRDRGTGGLLPYAAHRLRQWRALWAGEDDDPYTHAYYERNAVADFADVAQDIPGVLVGRGEVHPWLIMAGEGTVRRGQLHSGYVFLTQLHGSATVRLFPPTELPKLHLYPLMHPNAEQTQAGVGVLLWPWLDPDDWEAVTWMAHATPIRGFEVRGRKGQRRRSGGAHSRRLHNPRAGAGAWMGQTRLNALEMLYIPPFWCARVPRRRAAAPAPANGPKQLFGWRLPSGRRLYQVTHETPSIQLRTETSSYEGDLRDDLLAGLGLPVSTDIAYQALILRRVVRALVAHAAGAADGASVADQLLDTAPATEAAVGAWLRDNLVLPRFRPLYGRLKRLHSDTNFSLCDADRAGTTADANEDIAKATVDLVEAANARLDWLPTNLQQGGAGAALRDHILADYVERLVHAGLGAEDAYPFLARCFDTGIRNVDGAAAAIPVRPPPPAAADDG